MGIEISILLSKRWTIIMNKKFICCLLIAFSGLGLFGRIDKLRVAGDIALFEEIRASEPEDPEEPEAPEEPDEPEDD
jgi:hypothetical protein